jgi:hypothetical protein
MVVHACHPSYTGNRRITVQADLGIKEDPIWKRIKKAKSTQVIEHLPSKHEPLSSTSSTNKKKELPTLILQRKS